MSTGGSVGAVVAVIAAKKREEIFQRFRKHGAVSPSTGLPLEELGLGKNPMFRMQALKGAVVKAGDDRYYLDEETVARQQRFRRVLVGALLAILIGTVLALWLTGQA